VSSTAELSLLAAVLMRATRDFVVGSTRCGPGDRELAEEARRWLFDDTNDEEHITSFRNICLAMNLDRRQVRQRILCMLAEQSGPPAARASLEEG
jgi:hypothetical protein